MVLYTNSYLFKLKRKMKHPYKKFSHFVFFMGKLDGGAERNEGQKGAPEGTDKKEGQSLDERRKNAEEAAARSLDAARGNLDQAEELAESDTAIVEKVKRVQGMKGNWDKMKQMEGDQGANGKKIKKAREAIGLTERPGDGKYVVSDALHDELKQPKGKEIQALQRVVNDLAARGEDYDGDVIEGYKKASSTKRAQWNRGYQACLARFDKVEPILGLA